MRIGKMWAYGGHCHSFVTYINTIFRFYIWHLNSQSSFSFFSTNSYCISGLLPTNMKPVRRKIVDSSKNFTSFQILCWHHFNHQGRLYDPHIFSVCGGRNMSPKKISTHIGIQLGFRQLDFEKVPNGAQLGNSFHKIENYTLLWVHSKLQARGKYTNRNLSNNIIRLDVTKTEIFEKVVNLDEYFFSSYLSMVRSWRSPMQSQGKILNIVGNRALGIWLTMQHSDL